MSAYRWIDREFVPITDEEQISALEAALGNPLAQVRGHLSKALALVSDRDNPDEGNSIKESISAVESLCSAIVGKKARFLLSLRHLADGESPASGSNVGGCLRLGHRDPGARHVRGGVAPAPQGESGGSDVVDRDAHLARGSAR